MHPEVSVNSVQTFKQLLADQGDGYLVLDFNHLFIASTLREEVWVLRQVDDVTLAHEVLERAADFGIRGATPDRDLDSYSGGERVILACLLLLAVVRAGGVCGTKLLLCNILESLSGDNRARLLRQFAEIHSTHALRVYTRDGGEAKELDFGTES